MVYEFNANVDDQDSFGGNGIMMLLCIDHGWLAICR